jgi:hypothetical protein
MSSLVLTGDTSGQVTLAAPAVAGSNTLTLQAATATSSVNTLSTALAYNWNGLTTNTSLDFTSLPAWVKRITVMFNAVSTNGGSKVRIQLGAGSVETSGYAGSASYIASASAASANFSAGFDINDVQTAVRSLSGALIFNLLGSNLWICSGNLGDTVSTYQSFIGGTKTTSSTLDRVRITTVNGTDTFDAGSVNILYEG